MAAIKWGLAILISPMTAAALAPLKLLTQFGNLESLTDRHTVKTTCGFLQWFYRFVLLDQKPIFLIWTLMSLLGVYLSSLV